MLGRVLNSYSNELSRITQRNIELCFPKLSAQKINNLTRESLMHTSMSIFESGALWLWPVNRVLNHVREVSGKELVEAAINEGKGIIFVIPHLGAWEAVALYSSNHWPTTSLYRPPKLMGLDKLIRKGRERAGARLVSTDVSGVRSLRKALSHGEAVIILPDQDPGYGAGVFAPFFGIQANTMTLLSRLASKSGATVLTAYAERLPDGRGYHIQISPTPECLADKDSVVAVTCLNRVIEKCARDLPAQYQWAYKRFKNRPKGGEKLYGREPPAKLDGE
jgi:KDO2-lipid IV(A) lauroyltransferase